MFFKGPLLYPFSTVYFKQLTPVEQICTLNYAINYRSLERANLALCLQLLLKTLCLSVLLWRAQKCENHSKVWKSACCVMSQKAHFQEPFIRHFLKCGVSKKKKLKDGFLFYLGFLLLHNIQRQLKKLLLTCLGKKNVKKYHSINKMINDKLWFPLCLCYILLKYGPKAFAKGFWNDMGHLTLLPGSVSATDFFVQTEGSSFFWHSSFLYLRRIFAFQLNWHECCRCKFLFTSASASLGQLSSDTRLAAATSDLSFGSLVGRQCRLCGSELPTQRGWWMELQYLFRRLFLKLQFHSTVPVWPASLCPMGYPSWSPACMLDSLLLYLPVASWNWWLATSSTEAGSEHGSRMSV